MAHVLKPKILVNNVILMNFILEQAQHNISMIKNRLLCTYFTKIDIYLNVLKHT